MLGLADRAAVYDLFDEVMAGKIAEALDRFDAMYRDGADPLVVLQDILDVVYWLTRIKTAPTVAEAAYTPEMERTRGKEMADKLSMPSLTRAWQLTLKGVGEVQSAPNAVQAAQMALVRLAHAADLPAASALVRQLTGDGALAAPSPVAPAPSAPALSAPVPPASAPSGGPSENPAPAPTGNAPTAMAAAPALAPDASPEPAAVPEQPPEAQLPQPQSFKEVVDLFRDRREMILYSQLQNNVHLVAFENQRMELRLEQEAPRDLVNNVSSFLNEWTGQRWVITVSSEEGEATLGDKPTTARQVANGAELKQSLAGFASEHGLRLVRARVALRLIGAPLQPRALARHALGLAAGRRRAPEPLAPRGRGRREARPLVVGRDEGVRLRAPTAAAARLAVLHEQPDGPRVDRCSQPLPRAPLGPFQQLALREFFLGRGPP